MCAGSAEARECLLWLPPLEMSRLKMKGWLSSRGSSVPKRAVLACPAHAGVRRHPAPSCDACAVLGMVPAWLQPWLICIFSLEMGWGTGAHRTPR